MVALNLLYITYKGYSIISINWFKTYVFIKFNWRSIPIKTTPFNFYISFFFDNFCKFKEEFFLDFDLGHSLDVKQSIIDYVKYYNNERPAYSLKYKTPTQFKSELVLNQVWYMSTFAWQVQISIKPMLFLCVRWPIMIQFAYTP